MTDERPSMGDEGANALRRRFTLRAAWNRSDAYGWVLLLLVVDIAVLLLLPARAWADAIQVLIVGLTLLLALRTSGARRGALKLAGAAIILATLTATALEVAGSVRAAGITYFILAALLFLTPFPILRRILNHERVTARTLAGGLSVYLIIGLFSAFVFLGIRTVSGQPFFVQTNSAHPADYVYFSYVTELTIGYGDLTPAGDAGRFFAIMDGMLGQIFLVTTVARLVSLFGPAGARRSIDTGRDGSDETSSD